MYTSANMNLTVWDDIEDDFDHTQLQDNWTDIDQHDHSFGRGVQIGTAGIAASSITTALLAPGSVTQAILGNNSVGSNQIQQNAIVNALIATGAVNARTIANGSISYQELGDDVLPLGSVMLWYQGNQGLPGGGWEIMDGRHWSSITNSLGMTTGRIPDMRGIFAMGADLSGTNGPLPNTTGGKETYYFDHTHTSPHSHHVSPHGHIILEDGSHHHTWLGGLSMWSRANAFEQGLTINDALVTQRQNPHFTSYIKNTTSGTGWTGGTTTAADGQSDMDETGDHDHGGMTGTATPTTDTQSPVSTAATWGDHPDPDDHPDHDDHHLTIIPPYCALVFIMRVR